MSSAKGVFSKNNLNGTQNKIYGNALTRLIDWLIESFIVGTLKLIEGFVCIRGSEAFPIVCLIYLRLQGFLKTNFPTVRNCPCGGFVTWELSDVM